MKLVDLRKAYDYISLAHLLETDPKVLRAHLYGKSSGYTTFQIAKKAGGVREISAPVKYRRQLQSKLLLALQEAYRPGAFVHGFVPSRSIRSNAASHVSKKTVINVDLRDFFSSISFRRVRGVFLGNPFSLNWSVANIAAQICCHNGVLPSGALTSPVLSNIVMSRLDRRLSALVARLGGDYSRYADDLTMSFDRPMTQLSSLILVDSVGHVLAGNALSELIASEGFSINQEKIRVSCGGSK